MNQEPKPEAAELKWNHVGLPEYYWKITIPKGGNFIYQTQSDLTLWQRTWLRFIGWGVEKV